MTKKELLEELIDIPDDAVICGLVPMGSSYYEISSIEYMTDEKYYADEEDAENEDGEVVLKGNIVVI
jgi:hypothetical protein